MTGGARERDLDRVRQKPSQAVLSRDMARQDGARRPIDVPDRQVERHLLAALDGGTAQLHELVVEDIGHPVILFLHAMGGHVGGDFRLLQKWREVEALGLPVIDRLLRLQPIHAADHLGDRPEPQLRHQLPHLFGDEEEVVHDVLRLPRKFLAKDGILRGDPDRAGVQVALPHHDAAFDDEGSRREPKLLRAQQRGDDDVPSGLHLPVGFDFDPAAQIVQHEGLMRLRQAKFPRNAGIFNGGERGGARSAGIAADQHLVRVRFRDAGCHGADPDFGDELH